MATGTTPSSLRRACLNLLEAEYQLERKRHQHQKEDYTSVQDVDFYTDKHLRTLKRSGVYAVASLVAYVALQMAGIAGVIRDIAFVVLLVTGIPTLIALLRLLMTLPQRGKAKADEKRMAKKWDSFDAAESACTRQRQQLASSIPLAEGKRFMHIPALGAEKTYTGFHAERLRLSGGVNFVDKDGKSFVHGMLDMQPCGADTAFALLNSQELVSFYCDQDYLRAHPGESYLWGNIFCLTHSAPLKSHTVRHDQIDVDATMANYSTAFDRAERNASPSGRTHQESYDAGKMSFGDYRVAEDYKEHQMERERKELERHNTMNTHTTFYYDKITQNVYTAGLVVTTRSGQLIYAGYCHAGQDFMRFTYRLPKYERTSSGGGVSEAVANALEGELESFAKPQEYQGVNQRMVMDFVLQRFGKQMLVFDPLQVIPSGMADNDFRYWIELQYLYSRSEH